MESAGDASEHSSLSEESASHRSGTDGENDEWGSFILDVLKESVDPAKVELFSAEAQKFGLNKTARMSKLLQQQASADKLINRIFDRQDIGEDLEADAFVIVLQVRIVLIPPHARQYSSSC